VLLIHVRLEQIPITRVLVSPELAIESSRRNTLTLITSTTAAVTTTAAATASDITTAARCAR